MVPGSVRLAPISGFGGGGQTHEGRPVGDHELFGAEEPRQGHRLRAGAAEVVPHVAVTIDETIDEAKAAKVRQGLGPIRSFLASVAVD